MIRTVLRVPAKAGERLLILRRYEDSRKFELCDPSLPEAQNKKRKSQRQVDTVDEAIELIREGWYVRLWDAQDNKMNRIAPESLTIIEVPQ